jgi:alkanesulfonate monooxygenase SsuD/methylene tetrahydromethanopterin reductase-like flavin-dependent oxidoreductase (luciferase family)
MATIRPVLRLNMSGCGVGSDRALEADRFQAALDMAEYADNHGFAIVNVEEHHDVEIGWMGSPLPMAAAIAARTRRVQIRGSAVLVTLYDPLRLAEEMALLDVISRGRFVLCAGQGYRPSEYHMMDRDFTARGATMDFVIETLLKAWGGRPFDYRGQTVTISPMPFTQPHPPFHIGGMSKVAARRAARFGLPFFPAQPHAEIEALYLEECRRLGKTGEIVIQREMQLWFIDPDPDEAWATLGPHFLAESQQYSSWRRTGVERSFSNTSQSVDELRGTGVYDILTPDQALARIRAATADYMPIVQPLTGGLPLDRAWRCMELFGAVMGQVQPPPPA